MNWVLLIWTSLGAIGVVLQVMLLADSVRSLQWIGRAGVNGTLRRLAVGHIRSGLAYLVIHGLFLAIGASVMYERGLEAPARATRISTLTGWALVTGAVLLILAALANHRDRVLLRREA